MPFYVFTYGDCVKGGMNDYQGCQDEFFSAVQLATDYLLNGCDSAEIATVHNGDLLELAFAYSQDGRIWWVRHDNVDELDNSIRVEVDLWAEHLEEHYG